MIFTERTITIRNDSSTINAPVVLYRGDKNVEVRFTLVESPYKYSNRDSINIIESTNASYAQLVIKTPNDRDPIFGDITAVGQSNVVFIIGYDMIDEIEEVGTYSFQIRLFDADQTSMVTIPEVVGGFIIREPIAKEDTNNNITNSAIVGSAVVTNDLEIPTFVEGSYNKSAWYDGVVISRQKLDKIEDGIYETYELSKVNNSQIKEKANQDKVNQIEARISDIVAHNGDGTKDSEIIDARGGATSLGVRLNAMDYNGYVTNTSDENTGGNVNKSFETPVYINSGAFNGWGCIMSVDLVEIYSIGFMKYKGSITSNLKIEFGYNAKSEGINVNTCVVLETLTITTDEWNNLSDNTVIKKYLSTPINTEADKNYFARIITPSGDNAQVMQIGHNSTSGDDITTSEYFVAGLYSNNGGATWSNGSSKYSTYLEMYDRDYVEKPNKLIKIIPSQTPELTKKVKLIEEKLENKNTEPQMNFYYESKFKETPTFFNDYQELSRDLYVVAAGDSIGALMFSNILNPSGVSEVPPVCDKMSFGGIIWNMIKKGDPQYRRFDYGKKTLLGNFTEKWNDDVNAFFTESGDFKTYYGGGTDNNMFNQGYNYYAVTTVKTEGDSPILKFSDADRQKNIPKRCTNTANGYIEFTIPSGYKKFDFIYNRNQQGDDNVIVEIVEGAGKVTCSKDSRLIEKVEANNYIIDMSYEHNSSEFGYDDGECCRRIMFEKNDINKSITVRIKKSSDTSKYMIYWGITYWGTIEEPNAVHFINVHRGGISIAGIDDRKFSYLSGRQCDLLLLEYTLINDTYGLTPSNWISRITSILNGADSLIQYIKTDLNCENIIAWLPNMHIEKYDTIRKNCWSKTKAHINKNNIPFIDVQSYIEKKYKLSQSNYDFNTYFKKMMWDGVCHPNDLGWNEFKEVFEPNFEFII